MNVLLINGKNDPLQLESISSLVNTRVLINPTYQRLSEVYSQKDFDVVHIIGKIEKDENGNDSRLYFSEGGNFITPNQLSKMISFGKTSLVFLSFENSALFASEIESCDVIFLASNLSDHSMWEFPVRYYRILTSILKEDSVFRPRKAFTKAKESGSGYAFLTRLDSERTEVSFAEVQVNTNTSTIILDTKSLLMLLITALFTLFASLISFLSFLVNL